MRDIFSQADDLYDLGRYDNDGPDHVPNSGDDDGYVDMVCFWFLNYSTRGRAILDLTSDFISQDTSWGPGHVSRGLIKVARTRGFENRKDLRDVAIGLEDWLGPTLHEASHMALLGGFPDMEHSGYDNWYNQWALGSFDVMSNGGANFPMPNHPGQVMNLYGFAAWPSLCNPWFRAARNWTSYTNIVTDTPNLVLTDLDSTGQILRLSPSVIPPEASSPNEFLLSYHRFDPNNPWSANWPLDHAKGGVLLWHISSSSVSASYSIRERLPITLRSAHGCFVWNDTVNTGVQDPLKGMDSVLIRKLESPTEWPPIWWPYKSSSLGMATQSVFRTPDNSTDLSFYSNPNTNLFSNVSGENYARSVTSGFSVKNLRRVGNNTYADVKVNDYAVTSSASLRKGTWHIKQSITVQSGATLTIDPGTTLKFDPGKSLVVYGRLLAVGTQTNRIIFTSSSTSTKWGGILVSGAGANNSTIKHAIIERVETYGGSALGVVGTTGFLLDSCYIRNNTTYSTIGVGFTDAGSPEVRGNRIHGNGGYGILYQNTSGYLYADSIVSNTTGGVKCRSSSNVLFGKIGFPAYNGNCRISGGNYGVYAEANSNPTIGTYQSSYYGYNSITSTSTARVYASNSGVLAEMNWWGANPPQASWFQTSNGAIDWNPYLTSSPFGSSLVPASLPGPGGPEPLAGQLSRTSADPLADVRDARLRGDYGEARRLLAGLDITGSDEDLALQISRELLAVGHFEYDPSLVEISQKVVDHAGRGTWEELVCARLLAIGGMRDRSESILHLLIQDGKDAETQKEAALSLFFSYLQTQRFNQAGGVLSDRSTRWGKDEAGTYAQWLLSIVGTGSAEKPAVSSGFGDNGVAAEVELACYPNPFNPTTTIRYTIPLRSYVCLTVFNMLGEKVATLVDEEKAEGQHDVQFNASDLASGVYLYRLHAGNFVQTMKLLLVK